MWDGLLYRFPCLFYVGQDRALRFRCSQECDPVEVYLRARMLLVIKKCSTASGVSHVSQ